MSEEAVADTTGGVFWADEIADQIEARSPSEPVVIKGAVSPSGIPHIGHFNEIMRGYFVGEILRERGYDVRQIFVSDDRDALRRLPRQLADSDWNIVGLGDVDASVLGENLGVPYADIPDPFGEHDSYGAHFTDLLRQSIELVGIDIEIISVSSLYTSGQFDPVIHNLFENRAGARDILRKYQSDISADYVPFMAQCERCHKLSTDITGVDLTGEIVHYSCTGLEAGGQQIDGCGHEGTVGFQDGKLPWRFEWPAGWKVLNVAFEPFGKDHAEGSWPSGKEIAERLLGVEPPVPMVYEWFTLNGEALSSSSGNVITVPELLSYIEPEVLRYFFVKPPKKQRDLDLSRIDQLVDEFDRFEELYFNETRGTGKEQELADRAYPFVVERVDENRVRLPYTFAAVLGMTTSDSLRETMAIREGHLPDDADRAVVDEALQRVERARQWAEDMNNEYNYRIQESLPAVELDPAIVSVLDELAEEIEEGQDGSEIQSLVYDLAESHGIMVQDVFTAGYQLFLDQEQGPRLGPFLAALDETFVVRRLRLQE